MSFQSFHRIWLEQLRQLVQELRQAATSPNTEEHRHRQLVHKVISHYNEYYNSKSSATKQDVLAFFSTEAWSTVLERSLHWTGGWRPTTAFHLIYTESSIMFESHVVEMVRGIHTGDLGDLTPEQFHRMSELQIETVREENDVTDDVSDWQDDACNVVGMKHDDVNVNMEKLAKILERADQLRLRTTKRLVELLTPQQAAEFLVAAAELHFGIRGCGIMLDRKRRNN